MKKVLAVVIALVMMLSCASVAFAAEIANGQVYFGAKENLVANPGDTVTVEFEFLAAAFESENYDRNGTLVIPVYITGDASLGAMSNFQLTEEAVAAGATIEMYVEEADMIMGDVSLPASYLYSADMILATVDVEIAEDWEIRDYKAVNDIAIVVYGVDDGYGAYVLSEDENYDPYVDVNNYNCDSCVITYEYQAKASERLIERLKEIGRTILELIRVGLTFIDDILKPADWVK